MKFYNLYFYGVQNFFKSMCLLMMFTNLPTVTAETRVPMPTPWSFPKNRKDRMVAIIISVMSNIIFTLPNFLLVTKEIALTIPSPGTVITSGATSTAMPKARMKQPARRQINCIYSEPG